jgi:hypothetical protein
VKNELILRGKNVASLSQMSYSPMGITFGKSNGAASKMLKNPANNVCVSFFQNFLESHNR